MKDGPAIQSDLFARFRGSPLFELSRQFHSPGWTTDDYIADPKFHSLLNGDKPTDLRLKADSPAIDAGVAIPADWPDPLRSTDAGGPDIGAMPSGTDAWGVGVDGRMPLFGND